MANTTLFQDLLYSYHNQDSVVWVLKYMNRWIRQEKEYGNNQYIETDFFDNGAITIQQGRENLENLRYGA